MPAMFLADMPYRGHGTGRPRRSYEIPENRSPNAIRGFSERVEPFPYVRTCITGNRCYLQLACTGASGAWHRVPAPGSR
jgi:hypothetical protein